MSNDVTAAIQTMNILGTQEQSQQQAKGRNWIKVNSLYNQFNTQLDTLVKRLLASDAHFVKCIRPNQVEMANMIDSPFVMKQLMTSGLLESIKIHASGFEYRETIEQFVEKFWPLSIQKMRVIAESDEAEIANAKPGSLEEYIVKIFAVVAQGDESSPAHSS